MVANKILSQASSNKNPVDVSTDFQVTVYGTVFQVTGYGTVFQMTVYGKLEKVSMGHGCPRLLFLFQIKSISFCSNLAQK